jgi:hypothetical protein
MHVKHLVRFSVVLAVFLSMMPTASAQSDIIWYRWVRNIRSGLCIQPEYEAAINGITIVQQPCTYGNYYQQWLLMRLSNGRNLLVNRGSGMCLDLRDGITADWSPIQQWACNTTSTTMQWGVQEIRPWTYRHVNGRSGKCLDVRWGSYEPGAVIQIFHCTSNNGDGAQEFKESTFHR